MPIAFIVRWFFFGNLDAGLERFVLGRSTAIAFVAFIAGWYAWAFTTPVPGLQEVVFREGLIVGIAIALWHILKDRFRMSAACMIGTGAACIFWVTFGKPFPDSIFGVLLGGFGIVRGTAEGPKIDRYI